MTSNRFSPIGASDAEIRRQLKAMGAEHGRAQRSLRRIMQGSLGDRPADASLVSRRDVFRIGGLSVTFGALLAACGGDDYTLTRVGDAAPITGLPSGEVNDIVLLRTAASIERSALRVYQLAGDAGVLSGTVGEYVKRFVADHEGHAALFDDLTTERGGTAWENTNCKLDSIIIDPIWKRITVGADATDEAEAIPRSEGAELVRDLFSLANGLESLAAASYQSLVSLLTEARLRREAMVVGAQEARHAALLALLFNQDRPGGWVSAADAATAQPETPAGTVPLGTGPDQEIAENSTPATEPPADAGGTEVPALIAVPTQFGSLAAIPLVIGAADVNGARLKVNLETPSLNSLIYEYQESC